MCATADGRHFKLCHFRHEPSCNVDLPVLFAITTHQVAIRAILHCSPQRCDNETRVLQTRRCHLLMFTSLEILTGSLELYLRDWTMSIPCMTQYKSSLRRTNPNDVDYKSRSSEVERILWCPHPRTKSMLREAVAFFV